MQGPQGAGAEAIIKIAVQTAEEAAEKGLPEPYAYIKKMADGLEAKAMYVEAPSPEAMQTACAQM